MRTFNFFNILRTLLVIPIKLRVRVTQSSLLCYAGRYAPSLELRKSTIGTAQVRNGTIFESYLIRIKYNVYVWRSLVATSIIDLLEHQQYQVSIINFAFIPVTNTLFPSTRQIVSRSLGFTNINALLPSSASHAE